MYEVNNHQKNNKKLWIKLSITFNIIFTLIAIFSIIFLVKNDYLSTLLQKVFRINNQENFKRNPVYKNSLAVYPVYQEQKNIVMLGNSLTSYANWSELLNRNDVANRGISGDVTQGFLSRINYVFNLQPKICFIEGGVNDINNNIPQSTIINHLRKIVDTLKQKNIKPVLTTVTLLAQHFSYSDAVYLNNKIKELNKSIILLAQGKNIDLIDLNKYVSDKDFLLKEFAAEDGIHFSAKTYLIWKNEVEKILKNEGLLK